MTRLFSIFLFIMGSYSLFSCNKSEMEMEKTGVIEGTDTIKHSDTMKTMKLKITVGDKVLFADLYDNATAKSFADKLPLTLPMQDLYEREMVYRFEEALSAYEAHTGGYEVGDISYWTPWHSFVIFYKQNGEIISNLQKVGRIQKDVALFQTTGSTHVKFELIKGD